MTERITFSFGENWRSYVDLVSESAIESARTNIEEWLGPDGVRGKTVLDIGCGSGIHSLCFALMGARKVVSFDADVKSVEATMICHRRLGSPANWQVLRGSVLDEAFLSELGKFDVVYAWGVLHHTGEMWRAVENACRRVAPGGRCWLALYTKGPRYERDLATKRAYNAGSRLRKWLMERRMIASVINIRLMKVGRLTWLKLLLRGEWRKAREPLIWNTSRDRGMNTYTDIIDWLGGLPYEVASVEEVVKRCKQSGLAPLRTAESEEGGVSNYLFTRPTS